MPENASSLIKPKVKTKTKAKFEEELYELEGKLKASEEEKSILRRENTRLRLSADMLKQAFQKCKNCGHRLRLIDFNPQAYILACDHTVCKEYRTPVARISKEELSSLLGEAVEEPKSKVKQRLPKAKSRR